jgi:hypothetical protein
VNAQNAFASWVWAEADPVQRAQLQAAGVQDADHTNAHLNGALNFVVMQLLPWQVLARVKQELQPYTRKPLEHESPCGSMMRTSGAGHAEQKVDKWWSNSAVY